MKALSIQQLQERLKHQAGVAGAPSLEEGAANGEVRILRDPSNSTLIGKTSIKGALVNLVELKKHKEECGADEWYRSQKDRAWQIAYEALGADQSGEIPVNDGTKACMGHIQQMLSHKVAMPRADFTPDEWDVWDRKKSSLVNKFWRLLTLHTLIPPFELSNMRRGARLIAREMEEEKLRSPVREAIDHRKTLNTALGVILNHRSVIARHIVQWAESKVDLSGAEIIPDEEIDNQIEAQEP